MLTKKQNLRAERLIRLNWLIMRADHERELPGWRGGFEASRVRAEHVTEWAREALKLEKESANV